MRSHWSFLLSFFFFFLNTRDQLEPRISTSFVTSFVQTKQRAAQTLLALLDVLKVARHSFIGFMYMCSFSLSTWTMTRARDERVNYFHTAWTTTWLVSHHSLNTTSTWPHTKQWLHCLRATSSTLLQQHFQNFKEKEKKIDPLDPVQFSLVFDSSMIQNSLLTYPEVYIISSQHLNSLETPSKSTTHLNDELPWTTLTRRRLMWSVECTNCCKWNGHR